jgi:opacity protein-like surface antigen
MINRILAGFVVFVALLAPYTAAAQSTEGEPGQAPGWTFTPAVIVGWMYDSNVGMVTEGFNQDIRADSLMVVTPSGSMDYRGKHTSLGAGYSGTFRRYRDFNELDSFDQRLRVNVSHRPAARLLIFGREGLSYLPTTEETELNGVPFRRVGSRVNSAGAGFEYRLSKLWTLRTAYEFVDVSFDRQQGLPTFVVGGRSNGILSESTRRLTERLSLGGIYEIRFAQIKTEAGIDQPLRYQSLGAVTRYTIGPATLLSLAGGVSTLADPGIGDTRIGPFVRAGITHHLQRATLDGGYERSFVPTFGFAASTQTEQVHGSVLMPVYQNRVYVQASTSWRRNNPLVATDPSLKSHWLSATVGYAVARPVRLEGYYTSAWQDTRVAGGEVNRHRIGVQVVLTSPMRIP